MAAWMRYCILFVNAAFITAQENQIEGNVTEEAVVVSTERTQTSCGMGTYGSPPCVPCGKCLHSHAGCEPTTGDCATDLCQDGYIGSRCNTECPRGTAGANCVFLCFGCFNFTCNATDGQCLQGCIEGYTGSLCNEVLQQNGTNPVIIFFTSYPGGILEGFIGAIVLSVLLFVCFNCHKRKRRDFSLAKTIELHQKLSRECQAIVLPKKSSHQETELVTYEHNRDTELAEACVRFQFERNRFSSSGHGTEEIIVEDTAQSVVRTVSHPTSEKTVCKDSNDSGYVTAAKEARNREPTYVNVANDEENDVDDYMKPVQFTVRY